MASMTWTYFTLLMWKNFLIKLRHKTELFIEIAVPVAFSCMLIAIRAIAFPDVIDTPTTYEANDIRTLSSIAKYQTEIKQWQINYAPNHTIIDQLMTNAVQMMGGPQPTLKGFNTPEEVQRFVMAEATIAGVVFDVNTKDLDKEYPKKLKFSLRFPGGSRTGKIFGTTTTWMTKKLFPMQFEQGPRNRNKSDGGTPPGYIPEGFATLQNVISASYIKLIGQLEEIPYVTVQRFPYKPYVDDPIIMAMEVMVAFIILLSFVYPCIQAVKHVTTEKETQLKEAMKIMGLSTSLHWTAWFFTLWICLIVTACLTVCILKVPWFNGFSLAVFTHTSASLLLVFFLIYIMGLVTFSFMMSSFFTKANVAGAIAGLAWFACYIPYSFTIFNFVYMPVGTKLGFSVFLNTAMAFGFKIILNWEAAAVGAQWHNLFETITIEENLTLGHIMLMMIADTVIYMIITLYLEKIMPGSYGRVYKWYFPLMPSFWFPRKKRYIEGDVTVVNQSDRFEPEIGCGKAGIKLINLKKNFSGKTAVDGVSLNMFRNQITVLLGHNGAGKTTTISMITGLISPTSGTAIVNDVDILENMEDVRKSFGFCPQHNILFSELTVREHIIFYSRLKGLDKKEIEEEIDKYLKILEFEDKRNALAKTLSGGMKRKLSVGVALCGRSKVVLCDEPSSGMDPAARRSLWDLILAEKKGRTILLTTHFMDEADVLGDRIAIMSGGKLQCSGTPFFLKKRFGTGYQLICSKKGFCKTEHVTELIKKYIPEIRVKSDVGMELSYDLSEKYSFLFERMLKDLEDNHEHLNINGYGISMTTLEDVFMQTGSELNENSTNNDSSNVSTESLNGFKENDSVIIVDNKTDTIDLVGPAKRTEYQWRAMFLKKIYNVKHNWHIFIIQLLIPLILTIISIHIPKMEDDDDLPPLRINLDGYGTTITLLEQEVDNNIAKSYVEMFEAFDGNKRLDLVTGMSMTAKIIELQKQDLLRVNTRYMVAATISNNVSVGWFNNEALHTVPLALNLIYNAMVRALHGPDYSIEVTNAPLPFDVNVKLEQMDLTGNLGFQLATNITFAMAFVSGIFIMYMIKERVSRAKLLQFVSGVRLITFWLVHLIWDFLASAIISAALTILLLIYQEDGFATDKELGRVFLLFLVYGFGSLPLMYLISLTYDDAATGMSRLVMFHVFTGNALFITAYVLDSDIFGGKDEGAILKKVGFIFPSFDLAQGLANHARIGTMESICKQAAELYGIPIETLCNIGRLPECCDLDPFQWTENGIPQVLVAMVIIGLVTFISLLLIESRSYFMSKVNLTRSLKYLPPLSEDGQIDDDVQAEKNKVAQMTENEIPTHNLVMRDVTKYYGGFLAVNQLSVMIDKGECFGLLGVNGAGKTSTFKMLTGDETISHGNIWVKGCNTVADKFTVYEMIGYCPQFDGLLEDLTGNETLKIFSLLRGVPSYMISSLVQRIAKDLAFDKHLNKVAKDYSGGNRRKLSTAVAILGNPHVIYLDEPTTGIDPASRRKLWDLVCHIRDIGKAIVLTSHSMEECEALCTRIAIMVNGEFKCLGSTQHLKNKFAQGISLTIKLETLPVMNGFQSGHSRAPSTALNSPGFQLNEYGLSVQQFINDHFQGATLKDCHRNYLTFEIPINVMPYSRIFGLLEANKSALHIEDYSLSQSTLEQIFLNFAQKQRSEEENKVLRKRKKEKKPTVTRW